MRAALLTNTHRLDEDLIPFQTLVIGLTDEGVRVVQVLPDRLDEKEAVMCGQRIVFTEARWRLTNRLRLTRLEAELRAAEIELIHALDGELWAGAIDLGDRLEIPVVLSANDRDDVRAAGRMTKRFGSGRVAIAAATEPMAEALTQQVADQAMVHTIFPGVHLPGDMITIEPNEALCAVIIGSGKRDGDYQKLLEAIVRFVEERPMSQFFFDGQDSSQEEVWSAASQLGIVSNVSLTPRRTGHRELLLRAHARDPTAGARRGALDHAAGHGPRRARRRARGPVARLPDPGPDGVAQ